MLTRVASRKIAAAGIVMFGFATAASAGPFLDAVQICGTPGADQPNIMERLSELGWTEANADEAAPAFEDAWIVVNHAGALAEGWIAPLRERAREHALAPDTLALLRQGDTFLRLYEQPTTKHLSCNVVAPMNDDVRAYAADKKALEDGGYGETDWHVLASGGDNIVEEGQLWVVSYSFHALKDGAWDANLDQPLTASASFSSLLPPSRDYP